jgi:hypothetical protein
LFSSGTANSVYRFIRYTAQRLWEILGAVLLPAVSPNAINAFLPDSVFPTNLGTIPTCCMAWSIAARWKSQNPPPPFLAELRVNAGQDWAWAVVTKSFHRWEAASICLLSAENGDRNFIQRKRFGLQAGHTPAARTERQNYDGGRIHRYKRGVCDCDSDRYRCLYHGSPAKALNIGTAAHTVQPKAPLIGASGGRPPEKAAIPLENTVT